MKQPQERKMVVRLAKKGLTKTNRGAAGVGKVGDSLKEKPEITARKGDQKMEAKTGYNPFEMKNVGEDVLRLIKFSLDTTFENVEKLQKLSDKAVRDTIEAGKKAQADAENIVRESIENGKKGWNEYRKAVEDGFKKVEEMIHSAK